MNDTIPQWLARMEGLHALDLYMMLKNLVSAIDGRLVGHRPWCNCNTCKALVNARALLDEIGEKPVQPLD